MKNSNQYRSSNLTPFTTIVLAVSIMSISPAVAGESCEPEWDGEIGHPGMNGSVLALEVFDDGSGNGPALYAGGSFTTAGGATANHVAKWDGSVWTPLGSGLSGVVQALVVFDDGSGPALYAGGNFTHAGSVEVNFIAKWDGTEWSALDTGMSGSGGSFQSTSVNALKVFDDGTGPALYAGGSFFSAGAVSANYIAKWNGQQWSALGGGIAQDQFTFVWALEVFDDDSGPALYAGGLFQVANGAFAPSIARWNGQAWSGIGSILDSGALGEVRSLAVFDDGDGDALFAGGRFNSAGGVSVSNIAKWDGASWSSVGSGVGGGFTSSIRALAAFDDGRDSDPTLYVGGTFTIAGGTNANRIATWDGELWSAIGSGMDENVHALATYSEGPGIDAGLYAGGSFTTADGVDANSIALLKSCEDDPSPISVQCAAITASPWDIGHPHNVFDGQSDTLYRSAGVNPAFIQVVLPGGANIEAFEVLLSHHCCNYLWKVETAMSVEDMESQSGSYSVSVPWSSASDNRWASHAMESPVEAQVVRLWVDRKSGDDFVHINQWNIVGTYQDGVVTTGCREVVPVLFVPDPASYPEGYAPTTVKIEEDIANIDIAMTKIRTWYADSLGLDESLDIRPTVLLEASGGLGDYEIEWVDPELRYTSGIVLGDTWGTVLSEVSAEGFDPGTSFQPRMIVIFCKGAGGFAGGAQSFSQTGGGMCMLGDFALDSLADRVPEEWVTWWTGVEKQTGAIAHEMGHTLGLPHPDIVNPVSGREDWEYSVMGAWWNWPDYPVNPADPNWPLTGFHAWGLNAGEQIVEGYMDEFLLDVRREWFSTPLRLGDLNGDGVVDVSDLLILLAAWGPCPRSGDCPADLNGDGSVDVSDLLVLLANWG